MLGSYQQHHPHRCPTSYETGQRLAVNIKLIPAGRASSANSSCGAQSGRAEPSRCWAPAWAAPGGKGGEQLYSQGLEPKSWGAGCWGRSTEELGLQGPRTLLWLPQLESPGSQDISWAPWSSMPEDGDLLTIRKRNHGRAVMLAGVRGSGGLPAGPGSQQEPAASGIAPGNGSQVALNGDIQGRLRGPSAPWGHPRTHRSPSPYSLAERVSKSTPNSPVGTAGQGTGWHPTLSPAGLQHPPGTQTACTLTSLTKLPCPANYCAYSNCNYSSISVQAARLWS